MLPDVVSLPLVATKDVSERENPECGKSILPAVEFAKDPHGERR